MADKHKPVLSSRVSQKLVDRIDALVEETGISRADIIERALAVGLEDQENFVKELRGKVTGPLMELLLSPKFLNVVFALTGDEMDENQINAVKVVRGKSKGRDVKGKLAHG